MKIQAENENDGISRYVSARYISANDAFWRLYGFEIHSKHPPFEQLPCHLQDLQTILFQNEEISQFLIQGPPDTKLTALKKCRKSTARAMIYPDFPQFVLPGIRKSTSGRDENED